MKRGGKERGDVGRARPGMRGGDGGGERGSAGPDGSGGRLRIEVSRKSMPFRSRVGVGDIMVVGESVVVRVAMVVGKGDGMVWLETGLKTMPMGGISEQRTRADELYWRLGEVLI